MAIIEAVNSRASIGRAITYVTKEGKTESNIITGKDCDPFNALDDMNATKKLYGKTGGRQYKHYVQSFHKDEKITPEQAHKIACKLAEKEFKGYEVLIATHIDKDHLHSHLIINSVNFETGEKFNQSDEWLDKFKASSDYICKKHNLTITQKGKTFEGAKREDMTAHSKDKYNLLEKAGNGKVKSYVYDTALAVMDSKEKAISRDDFILRMESKGYKTIWEEGKKHITFENNEGKKVRASNLEKTFHVPFGKESLIDEFKRNARSQTERTAGDIREQRERITELRAVTDSRKIESAIDRNAERKAIHNSEQYFVDRTIRESNKGIEEHRQRRADVERVEREEEANRAGRGTAERTESGTGQER